MNEDQIEAFKTFWEDLRLQCAQNYPEVLDCMDLEGNTAAYVMGKTPVDQQRGEWVGTMNAVITLMQVADMEDALWAKAIVFRWVWDWELAHPVSSAPTTAG